MEVNIHATIGECNQFSTDGRERQIISVVISPLKVTLSENEDKMAIVTGCNMWRSCYNDDCWYSIKARERKKA